jgi:hypothetical protein
MNPTEEMLNAARDWSREKYGKPIGNEAAIGCWKAMQAAAPRSEVRSSCGALWKGAGRVMTLTAALPRTRRRPLG